MVDLAECQYACQLNPANSVHAPPGAHPHVSSFVKASTADLVVNYDANKARRVREVDRDAADDCERKVLRVFDCDPTEWVPFCLRISVEATVSDGLMLQR